MWTVYAEVLTLLTFAVVLGGVVFGGTTLAYFLDKHREDSARTHSTATSPADNEERRRGPIGGDAPTSHGPAA